LIGFQNLSENSLEKILRQEESGTKNPTNYGNYLNAGLSGQQLLKILFSGKMKIKETHKPPKNRNRFPRIHYFLLC